MATLEEAKEAFNALNPTTYPDSVRAVYAEYRIIDNEFYAAGWAYAAYRDIYQFDERFLEAEWSIPRNGYTEEQVPPATRAYEVEQHVYGDIVTYTEIL